MHCIAAYGPWFHGIYMMGLSIHINGQPRSSALSTPLNLTGYRHSSKVVRAGFHQDQPGIRQKVGTWTMDISNMWVSDMYMNVSLNLKSGQDLSIPKEIHITRTPIRSTRITRITHLCSVRITIAYSAGNLGKVSITICWFFSVKGGGGHTGHEAEISHNLLNLPMLSIPSRVAKGA